MTAGTEVRAADETAASSVGVPSQHILHERMDEAAWQKSAKGLGSW